MPCLDIALFRLTCVPGAPPLHARCPAAAAVSPHTTRQAGCGLAVVLLHVWLPSVERFAIAQARALRSRRPPVAEVHLTCWSGVQGAACFRIGMRKPCKLRLRRQCPRRLPRARFSAVVLRLSRHRCRRPASSWKALERWLASR